ncbi:MAG TPA: hypothetical protein VNW95_16060 [Mucilaginibacter sp.]|jgi:hypothetical protein|nr:hypothetical protein [Mucilaginibacter sp.]
MDVKNYDIAKDILTFYLQAESFPEGIDETFKKLSDLLGGFAGREVYGVSDMSSGKMVYRACVKEQYPGEAAQYKLPYYTIPKGKYLYTTLKDWRNHLPEINTIFQQLTRHPDMKQNSIVLEYYKNEDEALLMVQHR